MTAMSDDWAEFAAGLSLEERNSARELVSALRTPLRESIEPESDLVTPLFAARFRASILTQHAFVGTPLVDLTFERAFRESMIASGAQVNNASGNTRRFWDCEINGQRFSLKSTKARGLSRKKAQISKLTEAAWIQDCRTAAARRDKTRELFTTYFASVQRLVQLRYFENDSTYELLEIPLALLKAVEQVPTRCFQAEGPTIGIPVGQIPPDFTLVLDRSDAKVTLRNILVSRCIVHARWEVGPPATPMESPKAP